MAAVTARVPNFLGSGVDLIPLPTSPGFRTMGWSPLDTTSDNTSPFTGSQQMLRWIGADSWNITISLPKLSTSDAANWTATFLSLFGRLHAFQVGNQMYSGPQNTDGAQGSTPVVDGGAGVSNAPGTNLIATRGWTPGTLNVMTAGDYLQIGYRMYIVTSSASSDSAGKAQLSVWPSIRIYDPLHNVVAIPDGTAIDITAPVGIFRRADDVLSWTSDYTRLTEFSFKCREVK